MESVVSLVEQCPEPLTNILLVCLLCGAFGGLVAHFVNNEKKGVAAKEKKSDWFLYPSYLQSALIRFSGAIAFMFFIVAVGGLTTFASSAEQIRIIAVSVISGFGAAVFYLVW